jgi:methionyl-tRNA formyltransferase
VADPAAAPSDALPPGAFCDGLTVQTGAGRVRLLDVRPASGKLMSFEAFANGRHIGVGDRLLPVETG